MVVAIGGNISASILTCSVLISMKIPVIWAKAVDDRHGLILEQLGVHHVIYPEKDMGRRVAHLVRGAALDFIEVAPGYALVKAPVPSSIQGMPLGETGLRKNYGVTIAAFHHAGGGRTPTTRRCSSTATRSSSSDRRATPRASRNCADRPRMCIQCGAKMYPVREAAL